MLKILPLLALLTAHGWAYADTFKFKSKRDDDRVTTKIEDGKTIIDITSPSGISELVIERTGETWPENIVLRLRISGLEKFFAISEKVTLGATVKSHRDDKPVHVWVEYSKESPADPKSPFWMDFQSIGADGKPTQKIPLQNGYFVMRLPKPFFEGNPASVNLEWIDFLRK
ncbi:hypothetical protein [Zavarzinella formosa]|uniref:hypothetical protein n=1 Tax=Zavarzinella formosa TaxID=360055 RepID=UPI0002E66B20|nr:hypothetical protein [Zavarzinella formosa]